MVFGAKIETPIFQKGPIFFFFLLPRVFVLKIPYKLVI